MEKLGFLDLMQLVEVVEVDYFIILIFQIILELLQVEDYQLLAIMHFLY